MTLHVCPICGKSHEVVPAHQQVAWGRPLCCSCHCELERRRRVRKRLQDVHAERACGQTLKVH